MTTLISLKTYCPKIKVPLTKEDIFLAQVQKEDWINHSDCVAQVLPKINIKPYKWTRVAWHAFAREIKNIMNP